VDFAYLWSFGGGGSAPVACAAGLYRTMTFWQLFGNFLAIFLPLSGNSLAIFWQLSGNSLATFWQLSGNFLAIFWQFSGNFLDQDLLMTC
jgi:hypothetical protein